MNTIFEKFFECEDILFEIYKYLGPYDVYHLCCILDKSVPIKYVEQLIGGNCDVCVYNKCYCIKCQTKLCIDCRVTCIECKKIYCNNCYFIGSCAHFCYVCEDCHKQCSKCYKD